jgi:predicted dehydrogenase
VQHETMSRKVKVGLLGSGFVADFHMQSYRQIEQAEVVAVASRNRAESFGHKWGIRKHYSGPNFIEELCRDQEVDCVDIMLPNFLHVEAVRTAADNKKNIIIEKPLGRNFREAKEMLSAVVGNSVLHAYAENQLFAPQIQRAMEIISNGVIGKVFWVKTREAHFGPHSPWFWDKEASGGGSMMDMGCHSVEVARKLIGAKPVEVLGWSGRFVHQNKTEAEDSSLALVRYEGKELGLAENSWAAHGGLDLRFEVYGSDGMIQVDITRETGVKMFTTAPEQKVGYIVEKAEVPRGWLYPIWNEFQLYGYLGELQHFIESFSQGKLPRENFNDGFEVNKIIDAAYRSAQTAKWEKL